MTRAGHHTMMGGGGFSLLDYIKGGGAQFIDTGYQITPSDSIEFEIAFSSLAESDLARFIGQVQRPTMVYQISISLGYIVFQYFKNTTDKRVQIATVANTWLTFRADASSKVMSIRNAAGSVVATTTNTSDWPVGTATNPLTLFRRYDVTTCFDGFCRRFTVDGKHDWRAALNANGRPCMVDLINPAKPVFLYNGGTDEFTPGQVINRGGG